MFKFGKVIDETDAGFEGRYEFATEVIRDAIIYITPIIKVRWIRVTVG